MNRLRLWHTGWSLSWLYAKCREGIWWCKIFLCREIEIKRTAMFWWVYSLNRNDCEFQKSKVGPNICSMSTFYHTHSSLVTLAFRTRACVMAILVITVSNLVMPCLKFNLHLVEIMVPCRWVMGSWIEKRCIYHILQIDITKTTKRCQHVTTSWNWK